VAWPSQRTAIEAIDKSGFVGVAPKTLMVHRLFQRHLIPIKFDPASEDIFNLVLMPGDEVSW